MAFFVAWRPHELARRSRNHLSRGGCCRTMSESRRCP